MLLVEGVMGRLENASVRMMTGLDCLCKSFCPMKYSFWRLLLSFGKLRRKFGHTVYRVDCCMVLTVSPAFRVVCID